MAKTKAVLVHDFMLYVELFVFLVYVTSSAVALYTPRSVAWLNYPPIAPPPPPPPPPVMPGAVRSAALKDAWIMDVCPGALQSDANSFPMRIELGACPRFSMYQILEPPRDAAIFAFGTASSGRVEHAVEVTEHSMVANTGLFDQPTAFRSEHARVSTTLGHVVLQGCRSCPNAKFCVSNTCDRALSWGELRAEPSATARLRLTITSNVSQIDAIYADWYASLSGV